MYRNIDPLYISPVGNKNRNKIILFDSIGLNVNKTDHSKYTYNQPANDLNVMWLLRCCVSQIERVYKYRCQKLFCFIFYLCVDILQLNRIFDRSRPANYKRTPFSCFNDCCIVSICIISIYFTIEAATFTNVTRVALTYFFFHKALQSKCFQNSS